MIQVFYKEKKGQVNKCTYCICFVAGVSSILNSATGTLRRAICGANIAAGYTIAEVPMTRQASQVSTTSTAAFQERLRDINFFSHYIFYIYDPFLRHNVILFCIFVSSMCSCSNKILCMLSKVTHEPFAARFHPAVRRTTRCQAAATLRNLGLRNAAIPPLECRRS